VQFQECFAGIRERFNLRRQREQHGLELQVPFFACHYAAVLRATLKY